MKTKIILKEFGALSFVEGMVAGTTAPASSGSQPQRSSNIVRRFVVRQARRAEKFRELLHRRYTTPFPYQHWGLNE